jgi:hypothetical protein
MKRRNHNPSFTAAPRAIIAAIVAISLSVLGAGPANADGEVTTYTITYSSLGSTSGVAPSAESFETAPNENSVRVTIALGSGSLIKSGFTFRGWTTSSEGTGSLYLSGSEITLRSDLTLYPAFGGTITFAANGGSGTPASSTIDYILGRSITLPAVGSLNRATYSFLGWRYDLASRTYLTAGRSYTVSDAPTGNFSLYATWGRTVSFNVNGATIGSAPANLIWVDGDVPLILKTPAEAALKRRAFDQVGWSISTTGGVVSNIFIPTVAEQVLYASWAAQPTNRIFRIDFKAGKRAFKPSAEARIRTMVQLLDPEAVFPKQKIVVFLQSKRYVTQSSALGKARIKAVRRAIREAGIEAKIVWSNETRSSGSPRLGKNNRVISSVRWVN